MASTGGNACGTSSPGSKSRSPSPGLGLPGDAEIGELWFWDFRRVRKLITIHEYLLHIASNHNVVIHLYYTCKNK